MARQPAANRSKWVRFPPASLLLEQVAEQSSGSGLSARCALGLRLESPKKVLPNGRAERQREFRVSGESDLDHDPLVFKAGPAFDVGDELGVDAIRSRVRPVQHVEHGCFLSLFIGSQGRISSN